MKICLCINKVKYYVDLDDYPPEITLTSFIRECAVLPGTKVMCKEGSCGACIVTAKRYDPYIKYYQTISINSCLRLLNTCDGLDITTIEALGNKNTGYHPIQTTLTNKNGTQCGYCTPGMIMTMYSLFESKKENLTAEQIEKSFDGNTCRCTGYRPILDAMKSFANDSESKITDIEDLKLCSKSSICSDGSGSEFEFLDSIEDGNISNENVIMYGRTKCLNICKTNMLRDWIKIKWFYPKTYQDLFSIFDGLKIDEKYMLVCGGTGHGVYRRPDDLSVLIDLNKITELFLREIYSDTIEIGANTSISDVLDLLLKAKSQNGFEYCEEVYKHFSLIATVSVRNVAGLAGNLMLKHDHNEFPFDVFVVLETLNGQLDLMESLGISVRMGALEFLNTDMNKKLITKIILPAYSKNEYIFKSYKVMIRSQNSHAFVNAGFLLKIKKSQTNSFVVLNARICFGNINPKFVHASDTEKFMINKNLLENNVVESILKQLNSELKPDETNNNTLPEYRKKIACGLFYKFLLSILPSNAINQKYRSGKDVLKRSLSYGSQTFETIEKNYPVTQAIPKLEAPIQCSGEAFYMNDLPTLHNEVWAVFVTATNVNSILIAIDPTDALAIPDIVAFFGAKDIPGNNSFILKGEIFFLPEDEAIFCELNSKVKYYNQPVGMLVGTDYHVLERAGKKVRLTYEKPNLSKPILTLKEILENKISDRIVTNSTKKVTNTPYSSNIKDCKKISGYFNLGGQYHFTMEPQTSICIPTEDGMTVYCSTQWVDAHQRLISKCLNIPQKSIFLKTPRVGGGFGAKYTRSAQISCAAALASHLLNRPVRFVLSVEAMMRVIGKRYPLNSEYTVNCSDKGKITELYNEFYTDLGSSPNESPINLFTMATFPNCYKQFHNWTVNGYGATTDAASNTFCRAPGTLEAISMIENIMEHISRAVNRDPVDVRMENIADENKMKVLLPQFVKSVDYYARKKEIEKFNNENRWMKKGLGISIMQYGIDYFAPFYVYIVVYHGDGTVNISHGGIEMGQGINTKVLQVAAFTLKVPMENISFRPTDSFVTANSTFTAGSFSSEAVCFAVKKACEIINQRLKPIRDTFPNQNPTWLEIIQKAYAQNVTLNVVETMNWGELSPYVVYGLACSEVQVDVLTGNVLVKKVDILEDTGESLSPLIDIGQIEGAFIMGLGFWLTEKLIYDRITGEILTDRPFHYKIPLATDIPISFNINLLQKSANPAGFLRSKATGEPAVCLAISVIFAIRQALESARKNAGIKEEWFMLGAPTTPEEVLLNSGTSVSQFHLN